METPQNASAGYWHWILFYFGMWILPTHTPAIVCASPAPDFPVVKQWTTVHRQMLNSRRISSSKWNLETFHSADKDRKSRIGVSHMPSRQLQSWPMHCPGLGSQAAASLVAAHPPLPTQLTWSFMKLETDPQALRRLTTASRKVVVVSSSF